MLYFNTRDKNKENVEKKRAETGKIGVRWDIGAGTETMAAAESLKTSNFLNIQKKVRC